MTEMGMMKLSTHKLTTGLVSDVCSVEDGVIKKQLHVSFAIGTWPGLRPEDYHEDVLDYCIMGRRMLL